MISAVDSANSGNNIAVNGAIAVARPYINAAIWRWFDNNQSRVVISKWGILTVRVGNLTWIVEQIAGPRPDDAVS